MGRRSHEERHIRQLMRMGNSSTAITLPIEIVKNLGWRKGQKVVVEQKDKTIVIKDWQK